MSGWLWLGIAAMGVVGAPLRYVVDGVVSSRAFGAFPLGTLVVNVSGAFVLGVLTGMELSHGLGSTWKLLAGTGFCGAFTTFSTFAFETVALTREGQRLTAVRNVAVTLVAGCLAAAAGWALAAAI